MASLDSFHSEWGPEGRLIIIIESRILWSHKIKMLGGTVKLGGPSPCPTAPRPCST